MTAARAFRKVLDHAAPEVVAEAFLDEFPWVRVLPAGDLKEFVGEFIRDALAAAELGRWEILGQTVREWKATAAVYADPALLAALTEPVTEDHGPVPPPTDVEE